MRGIVGLPVRRPCANVARSFCLVGMPEPCAAVRAGGHGEALRSRWLAYVEAMHTLADELSPIFEAELGLPEGAFDRTAAERHFSELRAVEYPEVPPEDGAGGLRISPHRDFSLFSILLMDVRSNRTFFAPSAKTFRSWA